MVANAQDTAKDLVGACGLEGFQVLLFFLIQAPAADQKVHIRVLSAQPLAQVACVGQSAGAKQLMQMIAGSWVATNGSTSLASEVAGAISRSHLPGSRTALQHFQYDLIDFISSG